MLTCHDGMELHGQAALVHLHHAVDLPDEPEAGEEPDGAWGRAGQFRGARLIGRVSELGQIFNGAQGPRDSRVWFTLVY